jgi:hypothetical protein
MQAPNAFQNEAITFINTFSQPLVPHLASLSIDSLLRYLLSFVLLRVPGYQEIIFKSEKIFLKDMAKLDSF